MAQITSGLRGILSNPFFYNFFQNLLGADEGRALLVKRDLKIQAGYKMLDIGCGTAEILHYIPDDVDYTGYDISQEYIAAAKEKFDGRKVTFYNQQFGANEMDFSEKYDLVYCSGLLHHIEDYEAEKLFSDVNKVLKEGGRFVSADPCFVESQGFFSKFLVSRDRGQNIRFIDELKSLAGNSFSKVVVTHRKDFLRIPYDHVVLEGYK